MGQLKFNLVSPTQDLIFNKVFYTGRRCYSLSFGMNGQNIITNIKNTRISGPKSEKIYLSIVADMSFFFDGF